MKGDLTRWLEARGWARLPGGREANGYCGAIGPATGECYRPRNWQKIANPAQRFCAQHAQQVEQDRARR